MGNIKKISGAYSGGSPRKNYKNSSKSTTPTELGSENISLYEGIIKSLYLNNQMDSEDVQHFIYLLEGLKNGNATAVNLDSKFVITLITPINGLYLDGSINEKFLSNLISKLTDILELPQNPIREPNIKDKLSISDNIKNSKKVQKVKPKSKVDTSIKPKELDELVKIIDKKFVYEELTNEDISSLINYINHLLDPSTPLPPSQSTYFISKTIIHLEKLYLDGKLTQMNLEYLVASFENTLELTLIEKPQKQIKDKVSALSKNYKK